MCRMSYRVAVVGATGAVGQSVLEVLDERSFPVAELVPFTSARSEGRPVSFGGQALSCRALTDDALDGFDLVFMAAGGSVSAEWAPRFVQRGALVIDKTSYWRMDPEVPLVVPEINPDAAELALHTKGIISSPNCSTMAMVVALYPIHDESGSRRSSYRPISRCRVPAAPRSRSSRPRRTRCCTGPIPERPACTRTRSPSTCCRTSRRSPMTVATPPKSAR